MTDKKEPINIYQKVAEARKYVASLNARKQGKNTFAKYDYYTPDQVASIATQASLEANIEVFFDLLIDEQGYYGQLTIVDIDDTSSQIVIHQRTAIPEIKGANGCQKYGGMATYTERYMLESFFRIGTKRIDIDATPKHQFGSFPLGKKELNQLTEHVTNVKLDPQLVSDTIKEFGYERARDIEMKDFERIFARIKMLKV